LLKVEQVKQLALIAGLSTHHGKPPSLAAVQPTESLFAENHEPFFNNIGHSRHFPHCGMSGLAPRDGVIGRRSC
jgi:hypothetical protein